MQPSTAQVPQTAEDFDAVLVRFQAWSGSRKSKDRNDGVRELSYDEALRSSRYRRGRTPKSEATENIAQEPVAVTTIRAEGTDENPRCEISGDEAFPDEAFTDAPDTVSLSSAVSETRAVVSEKKGSTWPPVFGAILAEAITPAANHSGALARIWPAASKPERQVSMSLRVAASEQALIKARAAEAGISPRPICASARSRWSNCERRYSTHSPSSSGSRRWRSQQAKLRFMFYLADFSGAYDGASLAAETPRSHSGRETL